MLPQRAASLRRDPVADITLDMLESGPVRAGLAYWHGLRGGRAWPSREQIDPRAMRGFLRHVCLIRVIDGGADFEYRIVGDAHVAAYGFHARGERLGTVDRHVPGHGAVLHRLYNRVLDRAGPLAIRGWAMRGAQGQFFTETLFLPLGPDTCSIDHLFNLSDYTP